MMFAWHPVGRVMVCGDAPRKDVACDLIRKKMVSFDNVFFRLRFIACVNFDNASYP